MKSTPGSSTLIKSLGDTSQLRHQSANWARGVIAILVNENRAFYPSECWFTDPWAGEDGCLSRRAWSREGYRPRAT